MERCAVGLACKFLTFLSFPSSHFLSTLVRFADVSYYYFRRESSRPRWQRVKLRGRRGRSGLILRGLGLGLRGLILGGVKDSELNKVVGTVSQLGSVTHELRDWTCEDCEGVKRQRIKTPVSRILQRRNADVVTSVPFYSYTVTLQACSKTRTSYYHPSS